MQAPEFWRHDTPLSRLLEPLGEVWSLAGRLRSARVTPWRAPVPVLCVGNIVVGGAGKTPVAEDLLRRLPGAHALMRGYGGSETGPLRVAPGIDGVDRVGDEALLLAETAPVWVSRRRPAGAAAAAAAGARLIVMDDGFQNPSLYKDRSLVVIDAAYGFGNGRVLPAGPLRERAESGLQRADAVALLGQGTDELVRSLLPPGRPLFRGDIRPDETVVERLEGRKVVAFAGIGRPQKFFDTLKRAGARVVVTHRFADHYPYAPSDIQPILDEAYALDAIPVTTAKDAVRLTADQRQQVDVLPVTVVWRDPDAVAAWAGELLS